MQPAADSLARGPRRGDDRAQVRVLHDVVGRVIVERERARQRAQRLCVREKELRRKRAGRRQSVAGAIHLRRITPTRR
jgi:hypothetical protein